MPGPALTPYTNTFAPFEFRRLATLFLDLFSAPAPALFARTTGDGSRAQGSGVEGTFARFTLGRFRRLSSEGLVGHKHHHGRRLLL